MNLKNNNKKKKNQVYYPFEIRLLAYLSWF